MYVELASFHSYVHSELSIEKYSLVHGLQISLRVRQHFFNVAFAGDGLVYVGAPLVRDKLLVGTQLGAHAFQLSLPFHGVDQSLQDVVVRRVHRSLQMRCFFKLQILVDAAGQVVFENVVFIIVVVCLGLLHLLRRHPQ